jgi:hypothetical protein
VEYLLVALALVIAVGGIAAAIAFPTLAHERDVVQAQLDLALGLCRNTKAQLASAQRDAGDARDRYERLVTQLKAEIARLEGELDACHDPRATAARLSGLFAPPADAGAPLPSAANLPAQPSAVS